MPLDSTAQEQEEVLAPGLYHALLERLPETVRSTFTPEQKEAIAKATNEVKWGDHPVDIRLSIPSIFSRYYVVLLAGPERRNKDRRLFERARYPLTKACNFLFLLALLGMGVYLVLFIEMLFFVSHFSDFFGG